jgi:hypothetical protein
MATTYRRETHDDLPGADNPAPVRMAPLAGSGFTEADKARVLAGASTALLGQAIRDRELLVLRSCTLEELRAELERKLASAPRNVAP